MSDEKMVDVLDKHDKLYAAGAFDRISIYQLKDPVEGG